MLSGNCRGGGETGTRTVDNAVKGASSNVVIDAGMSRVVLYRGGIYANISAQSASAKP